MSSKPDSGTSQVSPVLFLTVKGEPMRFFLRPGSTKSQLQPVIRAGGGLVCRTQEPNAILLAEPEDIAGVPGTAAEWYVSTQYIRDCVEKNEQLEVEDYRFSTDQVQTKVEKRKRQESSRVCYTPEEDAAIMAFIGQRRDEARGNRVWQRMALQGVTSHSWQSMKDRYRKYLSHHLERGGPAARPVSAGGHCESPQSGEDPSSPSTKKSRQDMSVEEASPKRGHLCASPGSSSQERSPANNHSCPFPEKASPEPVLDRSIDQSDQECPQPAPEDAPPQCQNGKKQSDAGRDKMPCKNGSLVNKESRTVQEGRDGYGEAQEIVQEWSESGEGTGAAGRDRFLLAVQEAEVDDGRRSLPHERTMGILEAAILEFTGSEIDNETPDLLMSNDPQADESTSGNEHDLTVTAAVQLVLDRTSGGGQLESHSGSVKARSASAVKEGRAGVQSRTESAVKEGRAGVQSRTDSTVKEGCAGVQSRTDAAVKEGCAGVQSRTDSQDLSVHTSASLFERDSPEPKVMTRHPFSQAQLDWAKQQLRGLMKDSKQELRSITKALLRTSGDVLAALQYLLADEDGRKGQGPFWCWHDDDLLLSSDELHQHDLLLKYGGESVAKRRAFLDTE